MSSFLSIPHYSPFLVLLVGLSMFVGLWGLGTVLLSVFRARLPPPWDQVTAVLLGVQALSLTVQLAAMAEIASVPLLCGIWWVLSPKAFSCFYVGPFHGLRAAFCRRLHRVDPPVY